MLHPPGITGHAPARLGRLGGPDAFRGRALPGVARRRGGRTSDYGRTIARFASIVRRQRARSSAGRQP